MSDQIHLQIVTADGIVFDGQGSYVEIPLEGGSIGVLANHAPTIGAVCDGVIKCRGESGQAYIAVGQGVVNISCNEIIVLPRNAELSENIDKKRAEDAEKRARERIADKDGGWDMARAQAALYRSLARQSAIRLSSGE